jgi:hypothetical protein
VIAFASDVEALSTVAFVFALTDDATDVEAAVIFADKLDVAEATTAFVFAFTLVFPDAMTAANEVDADSTVAFVFAFTEEATEDDAAVIALVIEVEADVTSDWSARVPDESVPAVKVRLAKLHTCVAVKLLLFVASTFPIVPVPVKVDVATFHTSAARVPNVVRDRVAFAQTANGIVAASEVEAVNTVAFVLLLMVVIAEASAFVIDVEAFPTTLFVLALTELATEVEAAVIAAAKVDVAEATTAFVLLFTFVVSAVTFAAVAKVPEVRVASVRSRVAKLHICEAVAPPPPPVPTFATRKFPIVPELVSVEVATFQISATNVPNDVNDRELFAQIAAGKFAYNEVEALMMSACVAKVPVLRAALVKVRVALFQTACERVVVERSPGITTKLSSELTRSPVGTLPHVMLAGQRPKTAKAGIVYVGVPTSRCRRH